MTVRNVVKFEVQAGITGTGDSFIVDSAQGDVNVGCVLTAGSPLSGAVVQVTLDERKAIEGGTALWIDSPLGSRVASGAENIIRPVTGVRLKATDGTWTFQVRQG